ncbi:MAG: hypothetical protein KJ685_05220 [Nanoarchaeota archaeon]|nr:hypothetical protein [Nanoarchaeota archaeon]
MDSVKREKIREDSLYNAFQLILKSLKEKHDLNSTELIELISPQDKNAITIPIQILQNRQYGVLESTVVYLKDEIGLKYSEIARALNRDDRTIWTVYNNAKKKNKRRK